MGIKVEMEHTTDEATAKRIALDHLAECSSYYHRLKMMEEDCGDGKKKVSAESPWGLRWTEDRGMRQMRKEKDFPTEAARRKFIERMTGKDVNFQVESYSDPKDE